MVRRCAVLFSTLVVSFPVSAEPRPVPPFSTDDPRCGDFGYDDTAPMPLIPVAWPLVVDRTLHGELARESEALARVLARDLELSGVFEVLSPDSRPSPAWWTWMDEVTFDYLGWRDAGAYLVLVSEVSRTSEDTLRVRTTTFMTEEGDILRIGGADLVIPSDRIEDLGHRYISALLECLTGRPGVFGTRIAYSHRAGSGSPKEVLYIGFGSASPVRVSTDGVLAILPAWGPEGSLAYTGYRSGNPDLYIVERVGRPDMVLRILSTRPGLNTGASFSPRGDAVAVTLAPDANVDVYLLDPRSGDIRARLTTAPGIDSSPSWSPDGLRLAFVSDRHGGPQVFVMEADGSAQRPLPIPGSYNTSPDWSPDGTSIAWQSRGEGGRFSIWRYDLDSGTTVRLTAGPWDDEEPSFSPDGRLLVFTSTRQGPKRLFVMTRDGRGVRGLDLGPGEFFTPAWERRIAHPPLQGPLGAIGSTFRSVLAETVPR